MTFGVWGRAARNATDVGADAYGAEGAGEGRPHWAGPRRSREGEEHRELGARPRREEGAGVRPEESARQGEDSGRRGPALSEIKSKTDILSYFFFKK